MILHTFGDSHSHFPWEGFVVDALKIKVHHLGPKTCASFGFEKFSVLNIKNGYDVNEGDIVCFSFGEVDCRSNVHKHREQYKELLDKIVENYFIAIKMNVEQFNNIHVIVICVPPVRRKLSYINNVDFPTIGEDGERKVYVEYINNKFSQMCEAYKYFYLNTYNQYCDNEGFFNSELSDKTVHIRDTKYIREELMKILNIIKCQ